MTSRQQLGCVRPRPDDPLIERAPEPATIAPTPDSGLGSVRSLQIRLGCSAPNRVADRAGRYRRLAVGLALLPIPLLVMALAAALDDAASGPYVAVHVAVAAACAWTAVDLIWRGSVLDQRDLPLASAVAVMVGHGLLAHLRPVASAARFGPPAAVLPVLTVVALAFAALVVGERSSDRLLSVLGRAVLAAGMALLGLVELAQTTVVFSESPTYAVALGVAAWLLMMTAYFEARVLLRGVALLRLPTRR